MNKLEIGNFIRYKTLLMAVVAINEKKNKAYALCFDNHLMATFALDDTNVRIVKTEGCPRIVQGIYDLMKQHLMFGEDEK